MNPKKQKEKQRRRARKLADEAWLAVENGNLDLAEKIIRRAVDTQPDNPCCWHDQGGILALRGKDQEAEDSYRDALRLAPTFAEAYDRLAALRARQGYPAQAVALQAQAVKHAPQAAGFVERLEAYQALAGSEGNAAVPAPSSPSAAHAIVAAATTLPDSDWQARFAALDWPALSERLTREGCALLPRLLDAETCAALRLLFDRDACFAKTVVMDRPAFGLGVYRYFGEPLPEIVTSLRRAGYPFVARIANHWQELLAEPERYPPEWDAFRTECKRAGQTTPTPLLLKYGPGGFNALHRDVRGRVFFPLQMAIVLSPCSDAVDQESEGFQGGAFLFCDVPEGKKARRRELAAGLGDALLFCTRDRLVAIGGAYGLQPVKHGVAPITRGTRLVLGLPWHDYS